MRAVALVLALLALAACDQLPEGAQEQLSACVAEETEANARIAPCTDFLAQEGGTPEQRANALVNRGFAHVSLGNTEQGRTDFNQALEVDPRSGAALAQRARLHIQFENYSAALVDISRAIELYPTWTEALAVRADLYDNFLHEPERAIEDFNAILRLSPDNAVMLNNRCWTRGKMGRGLDIALADCNRSLEIAPGSAATLDSRGLVYLKLGRDQEAFDDYAAAIAADPEHGHAYYGRGIAASRLGRAEEAAADMARGAELLPEAAQFYAGYGIRP